MFEAGVVGAVILFGALVAFVSAEGLLIFGGALVAVGFVGGIPAAFVYHVKLWRELQRVGIVPKRWWLSPMKHHGLVDDNAQKRFTRAGSWGAVGFVVIVLGCFLVGVGLWKLRVQPEDPRATESSLSVL